MTRVSIHGGHSGEFCQHAENTLEEVIQAYIAKGFAWVGITEHVPPVNDRFLYPDEVKAGLTASSLAEQFDRYVKTCRSLQEKYADRIKILVASEAETCSESVEYAQQLKTTYDLDYIVGSVHHVRDHCFDTNPEEYLSIVELCGGWKPFYEEYFDAQYGMLKRLQPTVVGHFDYVRRYDPEYPQHLIESSVWVKIERNLSFISENKMILDFNVSPLRNGGFEPYVSGPLLKRAKELGIRVIPGDDSHGVATVGSGVDEGIEILAKAGFDTTFLQL